ncbi:hypothetical protein Vafri_6563, partial [Volvox africanus]
AAPAAAVLVAGCSYTGCTSLAGASEVLQGRAMICRCERVSYCSSTCQMLDWMSGHHQVCKMRPRKNEPTVQVRGAPATDAAVAESIGAPAAGSAARSSFGRKSLVTRR